MLVGGFPYFVNGLSGASITQLGTPIAGSQVRFNKDYGATLATADDTSLNLKFITRTGALIDDYTIGAPPPPPMKMIMSAQHGALHGATYLCTLTPSKRSE